MTSIGVDLFPDEEPADIDYEALWTASKSELKSRCAITGLGLEDNASDGDVPEHLVLHLPNGRDKRSIMIADLDTAQGLLSIPFEKYVFLASYEAVCCYSEGTIEAALRPLVQIPPSGIYRRLIGPTVDLARATEEELRINVRLADQGPGPELSIGPISDHLTTLMSRSYSSRTKMPSLRITGIQISQHDQAVEVLERLANSFLFQIDLLANLPLMLIRERRGLRTGRLKQPVDLSRLQFPRFDYDQRSAALYWYARSAAGLPLLQFLAFYQCLEFYFPIYSRIDAQRRIRNVLKDPTFNPNRDPDVNRILAAVRANVGRTFGDERAQLRATIQECVDADSLRGFLIEDEERHTFFTAKTQALGVKRLPSGHSDTDLRADVADRIYELRCKIVHTKHGVGDMDELDLLLPFSPEAELLGHDIALVQYVARQVLVASSSPLAVR